MLVITDIRKHGDGRVEVQNDLHNSRIALCADQGWNHSEIDVVCRQIGFQGAAENATSNHYPMSHFVPGTTVYRLMCSGSEKTIQACRREPVENCLALAGMMCKIKGGWSLWSGWSKCSVTCEDGQRTRTRACNHPPPNYGGTSCPGDHVQYTPCTEQMCPMDGVWNAWTAWNECSHTCGYGNRNRSRTCRGPFHDGAECPGLPDDVETCNAFSCPVDGSWKLWGTWGECSTTCGGGLRNRSRECDQPKHGGDYCAGPSEQAEVCNDIACPIDGVFTDWSEWYTCDVTCGGGIQWRNRSCIGPFNGGVNCSGDYDERQDCNTQECPVPGLWHEWSVWSLCTVTCGGGTRHRSRTCDVTSFGNLTTPCEGPSYEEDNCHTYPCLPLAIHCADWASRGLNQSCIADVDPDGEHTLFGPVQVECDFNTKPREAITVLHHDQEKRTQVKGYEEAGEYQVTLNYVTGWREAIKIVDSSKECAQFMRWDCKAAIIHNPSDPETLTTFWMNRTGQKANYFGGGSPGSGNCACGETRSCFNTSLHCNCDENDEVWRHDEGFVTNKDELPIHTFHAGDTGGSAEDGFLTIGPILCTGHA
ncbi:coadhesin-like isoform X2 [Dreissena polymorpha]|uniref:coadhesin-like isoform X2 n=1 Tax=Dreissena polymorpha TaxID=45954 RepID=UPI002263ECFE|nr:coadhesin-like isoform X2 [Dreissena polymorpha]